MPALHAVTGGGAFSATSGLRPGLATTVTARVRPVPIASRLALLFVALALCAPGLAVAQTSTISDDGAGVSTQPPVELGGDEDGSGESSGSSGSQSPAGELPNTGSDPRLLLLAGVALLLTGVGLRLRTADAELY